MIHFDLPKQKSSIIKVLGVGGGGSNAVNYMYAQNIQGVDFIICNTDSKALEQSEVPNKIQLGPHLTQGLGAGANPEIGKQATEESLDEIKRILEVNTKMAFICAGMGGGTGTGGAPIMAQICRDLGILTVGIVTTPFSFEGPRRQLQAEKGIKELEPYVDTLLVISNDKLRVQYGNLKTKEAFGKADNVLATAAKCITDIINSKGHIIVDFADVCTVMKNGGVAILGSSAVEGEDRAQKAIEEALNSPLLNDNEIKGAKWILININSAEGDHECTMDEMDVINAHLRREAGAETDVIMGMGYENSLDKKLNITLIATGFEHKDPFVKSDQAPKAAEVKEEKIVMTLGVAGEEKKMYEPQQQALPFEEPDPYAPRLNDNVLPHTPVITETAVPVQAEEEYTPAPVKVTPEGTMHFELKVEQPEKEEVKPLPTPEPQVAPELDIKYYEKKSEEAPQIRSGFLSRPSNIYAEPPADKPIQQPKQEIAPEITQPVSQPVTINVIPPTVNVIPQQPVSPSMQNAFQQEEVIPMPEMKEINKEEEGELKLVIKQEPPKEIVTTGAEISAYDINELEEEQKRKAAERIQKLRNLSFNMTSPDANSEFDSVPAYVRRQMDLFGNTLASVENFYSKYTVKKDENTEETKISSINTFLDGNKPD